MSSLKNLEYDLTQAIQKVARKESPKIGVLKTDTLPSVSFFRNIASACRCSRTRTKSEKNISRFFENLEKNYSVTTVDTKEGNPIDTTLKSLIIPGG